MSTEIEVEQQRGIALPEVKQPDLSLLSVMERFALNPNLDADKIERLFNIFIDGQRKMQEMADEREFSHQMADFKKRAPEIVKNRIAKMSGTAKGSGREYSMEIPYADLDAYATAIMGGLAERGISWSFPFSESGNIITVSCVLRYGLFESKPTTLSGPPEDSGIKNPLQAKGSTVAYLERYTLCGATGFTAAMPDNDGNKTGLGTDARDARLQAIKTAPDMPSLKNVYLAAKKAALDAKDSASLEAFTEAGEARKKELTHA